MGLSQQRSGVEAVVDDGDVLSPEVSIQLQVYRQLRSEITDGLWEGRADFPGEREVAARFGVSVITSRGALDRLAVDGYVERRQGRRTKVVYVPPAAEPSDSPSLFPRDPDDDSFRFRVLRVGVAVAPAEACRSFGLPAGTALWQCHRLWTHRGRPHLVSQNVQLPEVGERHSQDELNRHRMFAILRTEGLHIDTIWRRTSVASPPPLVARHLGLSIDTAVLILTFTLRGPDRAIIEWVRCYVHPERREPIEVLDQHAGLWSTR